MSTTKHGFFLTRKKEFVSCEVESETKRKRVIKITEKGHKLNGKHKTLPPEGVAVGKLFPRVFITDTKPTDYLEINGRVLLKRDNKGSYMVPDQTPYKWQNIAPAVVDSVIQGDKVLLTGEAGTGKTSLIEQIAARINQPVLRVNLNGETRIGDFLGRLNVVNGDKGSVTHWTDGILPTAMKKGYWLILDEIDMAEPNILSLLHPVLEPNGRLILKENNGEEVKPHPDFRIFGTANGIGSQSNRSDTYAGVNSMNEAFLDRWHIITMPNMDAKTEIRVLKDRYPLLAPKFAKRIVQFANTIRKGAIEGGQSVAMTFSTRRALQWAEKLALYRNPKKSAEAVFLCKVTPEDRAVLEKLIETIFGSGRRSKKLVTDGANTTVSTMTINKKRGRPRKVKP